MSARAHDMPFGAMIAGDGTARFRLWAPSQREVHIEIDGAAPRPLQARVGGWHELRVPARAGARYRYVLDDGRRVPDPASRFQPDDVHGPSELVDPGAYRWRHDGWRGRPWHDTVLYELHAGVCGGFAGVRQLLPQLADLGVTAVELMPVADFRGRRNWGYDGVLPYAPDAAYGRPEELKALVDAAHGLGLMVFLDVVYNHFGPDGNHLHSYAPAFFREDRQTPWGAAIDFRRREVRDFFIHNALYWLREYRMDGLRLDAVHAIGERDFLEELAATVRRETGEPRGRHVHLVLENEHNDAGLLEGAPARGFNAQWNDDFHNAIHVLLTGEHEGYYGAYRADAAGHLARCLAEGFAWQGEPMPDGHRRGSPSGHLPPTAFVAFLQNHDQVGNRAHGQRLAQLADPAALRAATALLLLAPHVPLLFMGEDWGCEAPFLFFTDFEGELADAVREGRRREFARFAAFADAAARASIPDPNAPATFERSRAVRPAHETPVHSEHRALLRLRRERLVPRLPGARAAGARALGPAAVHAQWRLGDGSLWTLASNLGAAPVACAAPAGTLLHATRPALADAVALGALPPRCTGAWLEPAP